jgi:hypothetical protein
VAALTAAAAIGVGARRQLRELGLLAATGADRWQLGAVVLLQGAGLGLVGGLAGIPLGLAATRVAFPIAIGWLEPVFDERRARIVPEFSVVGRDLRWVATFTLVVALLVACRPALGAARVPVVAGQAGRGPGPPRRRGRPAPGPAGPAPAGRGRPGGRAGRGGRPDAGRVPGAPGGLPARRAAAAAVRDLAEHPHGTVIALAGAALCTPALVALAGRAAPQRPTALRLAARDAARHPGRSAPAVAAMAAGFGMMVVLAAAVPNESTFNSVSYRPEPLSWSPPFPVALRVQLAVFTAMTLAVVLSVDALGRAESRHDLAVLDAVGASPRTRRALAAASAWLLTELGALLGTAAALLLLIVQRIALALSLGLWPAPVPWVMIGLVLFAVPALSALAGAATAGGPVVPLEPRTA